MLEIEELEKEIQDIKDKYDENIKNQELFIIKLVDANPVHGLNYRFVTLFNFRQKLDGRCNFLFLFLLKLLFSIFVEERIDKKQCDP